MLCIMPFGSDSQAQWHSVGSLLVLSITLICTSQCETNTTDSSTVIAFPLLNETITEESSNYSTNQSANHISHCASDEYQCLVSLECVPHAWCCDHVIDCADTSDEWPYYSPLVIPRQHNHTNSSTANGNQQHQCNACGSQYYQCPDSAECIPRGWLCDGQLDCGQTEKGTDSGDEINVICDRIGKVELREDTSGNLTASLMLETIQPYVIVYNRSKVISLVKSFANASRVFYNTRDQNDEKSMFISTMLGTTKDARLCWINSRQSAVQCISMLKLILTSQQSLTAAHLDALMATNPKYHANEPMSADQPATANLYLPLPSYIEAKSITRLLLDWLTDNWYLLDSKSELLYLCSSRFERCLVVAQHPLLSRPLAMELDSSEGLMFIARHGDRSRFGPHSAGPAILKATLDGRKVETLVDVRLVEPSLIALDVANRKLYWIDTYLDILESVDYDGQHRNQIKLSAESTLNSWSHTQSLFANANKVYLLMSTKSPKVLSENGEAQSEISFTALDIAEGTFTSKWYQHRPQGSANSFGSSSQFEKASIVFNVAVSSLTKLIKMLCVKCHEQVDRQDHQLCVPQFDYVKQQMISADCLSATMESKGNRSSKEADSPLMVYSRGEPGLVKIVQLHNESIHSGTAKFAPITFSHCPTLFDMDQSTHFIYYLDDCERILFYQPLIMRQSYSVQSINLNSFGFKQIESLSIDWIGKNLYLVDSLSASINVISLRNHTLSKQLIGGLGNPKAIALDPNAGLMFFSQYGHNMYEADYDQDPELGAWIKRAKMDGTRARIIEHRPNLKFPNSISLDTESKHVYWCDGYHHRLERVNYDGSNRVLLVQSLRIGIANSLHFDSSLQILFWTELQHGTIQRFDLKTNVSQVVLQEKAPLYQVKLFDNFNQMQNNEHNFTANCDQFSLLTPEGTVCDCAVDYIVDLKNSSQCNLITKATVEPVEVTSPCPSTLDPSVSCHSDADSVGEVVCSRKHFKCDKGRRCIPYHWLCDGHKDCWDRADESPWMTCHNATCPVSMFQCQHRRICIDRGWRCDGERDCGPEDGSDEDGC